METIGPVYGTHIGNSLDHSLLYKGVQKPEWFGITASLLIFEIKTKLKPFSGNGTST